MPPDIRSSDPHPHERGEVAESSVSIDSEEEYDVLVSQRSFLDRLVVRFPRLKRVPLHHIQAHWLTISFILGFVIDNFTMVSVESVFDNVLLTVHISVIMGSLLLLYAGTAGRVSERLQSYAREWSPMAMQFSFGGLLGGMFIFYGRSGAWSASWPFLLIIVSVMLCNELVTRRAQRLQLNLTMFFVGLFAYLVLIVPVLLGKMGPWIFAFSGVLALLVMYCFVRLLALVVPNFMRANMRMVVFTIGLMYVGFNALYFSNIIPPIPLSLKELGAYHRVVHQDDGDYALTYEQGKWYEFWKRSDTTYHYRAGDTVYCFAAVFAPTRLSTEIFHRWERYVPQEKKWEFYGRFSYSIGGGREDGFRGYTLITHVQPGWWRCTVETERGQALGSKTFEVVEGLVPQGLVTELR